ncbi:MAG: motif family protein [Chthoniobacter sp.]|nr:motif family protein [Chthoniobacter sp.]
MTKHFTLLTLTAAALLAAPAALRAEDPKPAPPGAGGRPGSGPDRPRLDPAERVKMMKEKLGLSDEQAEKVKAVLEKNREKFAGLKDLKPEERRAKMGEAMAAEREEIGAILTPEQKEKMKEEVAKRREEGGARRGGKPGDKPGPKPENK